MQSNIKASPSHGVTQGHYEVILCSRRGAYRRVAANMSRPGEGGDGLGRCNSDVR
jgi:hypothetical protein